MGAQMCAELTCRLFGRLCICTIVSKFGKLGTIATDFPDPTEEQLMMPTGVYSTLYTPNKQPVSEERAKFYSELKQMCPVFDSSSRHDHRTRSGERAVINLKKWTSAAKTPLAVYHALQAVLAMVSLIANTRSFLYKCRVLFGEGIVLHL